MFQLLDGQNGWAIADSSRCPRFPADLSEGDELSGSGHAGCCPLLCDSLKAVSAELVRGIRCVVFDVGETLVDESRLWADMAQQAGITPFTLCGVLGALSGGTGENLWVRRELRKLRLVGVGKLDGCP